MISFRELGAGIRRLELEPNTPLMVHASLSSLGEVRGGAETLLGALVANFRSLMMPTFTYRTIIIPQMGPAGNGMRYGNCESQNNLAEFYKPDMPADRSMGILAETFRQAPYTRRSRHPILSFAGVNASSALEAQSIVEPLAPIAVLNRKNGWVLLIGVSHTSNTSLHYVEQLAGRKQFVRWALTYEGVLECSGWPGCSNGFDQAQIHLDPVTRKVQIGGALVQALPLQSMVRIMSDLFHRDPLALLCSQTDCERCSAVREQNQRKLQEKAG